MSELAANVKIEFELVQKKALFWVGSPTMFDPNKTVFLLGAGASWRYGYPTGEDLVKIVIDKADRAIEHLTNVLQYIDKGEMVQRPKYFSRNSPDIQTDVDTNRIRTEWKLELDDCVDLISRLTAVEPLVIDPF